MTLTKRLSCYATVAYIALCFVALAPQSASAQQRSLYERLGGYDAINAVVGDLPTGSSETQS